MLVVDDVVQHHAAVAVRRGIDVFARTQAGDDDGHFVLHAHFHIVLQAVIALVHDLVNGKRRSRFVWIGLVVGIQRFSDLDQPLLQLLGGAGVERGHRADYTGDALGDDEFGGADDEKRGANNGQGETVKWRGQFGHG